MTRRRALVITIPSLLAIALAGCVQDGLVPCGAAVCPAGDRCIANACTPQAALDACTGLAEADACTLDGEPGSCAGTVCVVPRCGNAIVEAGERCDDGNTADLDGCSARCDSDETCGNGFVDLASGEQCDEGITALSGDGCTSECGVEFGGWQFHVPGALGARYSPLMTGVTGPHHAGVLLVGAGKAETWLWTANQFVLLAPRHQPPARYGGAILNDTTRHRVWILGGFDIHAANPDLTDIWQWDDTDWRDVTPAGPHPTGEVHGAYDPELDRFIVFDHTGQTWVGLPDGTWSAMTIAGGPSDRQGETVVYAPLAHAVLLYGGITVDGTDDQSWLWTGTTWSPVRDAGPPGRFGAAAAIASDGAVVLAGGLPSVGSAYYDTWRFDGSWSPDPTFLTPGQRYGSSMAFDPVTQETLVYGGSPGGVEPPIEYPLVYTPLAGWHGADQPTVSLYCGDGAVANAVTWGRVQLVLANDEVEAWTGEQWQLGAIAPFGCGATVTFDPARDEVVAVRDQTWVHDGVAWSAGMVPSPPVRTAGAFAYDPRDARAVLFGGTDGAALLADTWVRDSATGTWALLAIPDAPPARMGHGLTYDETVDRLVLYGGHDATGPLVDTWELDGTTWTRLATTASPPRADEVALTTGPRGRPMAVVGTTAPTLWELQRTLTEARWVEIPTSVALPTFDHVSLGYDATRAQLVLAGFRDGLQTWTFAFESPVVPRDRCLAEGAEADNDGDHLVACADPDCAGLCDPRCLPYQNRATCPADRPRCGDGTCSTLEDYEVCPADCAPP